MCLFITCDRSRAETVECIAVQLSVLLALMIRPFMPTIAAEILKQAGVQGEPLLPSAFGCYLQPGHPLAPQAEV